jgi:periplasmic divalent cation tolerance protein
MPTIVTRVPPAVASEIARGLLEERLIAAANWVDCDSLYRWDGAIVTDEEAILLLQTGSDSCDAVRRYLEANHPYDVPSIEQFEEDDASASFVLWRDGATDAPSDSPG